MGFYSTKNNNQISISTSKYHGNLLKTATSPSAAKPIQRMLYIERKSSFFLSQILLLASDYNLLKNFCLLCTEPKIETLLRKMWCCTNCNYLEWRKEKKKENRSIKSIRKDFECEQMMCNVLRSRKKKNSTRMMIKSCRCCSIRKWRKRCCNRANRMLNDWEMAAGAEFRWNINSLSNRCEIDSVNVEAMRMGHMLNAHCFCFLMRPFIPCHFNGMT